MFATFIALLVAAFFFAAVRAANRQRTCWELLDNDVWMQRRTSNYKAHFVFRIAGGKNPSSLVPALWEIKMPFSNTPKYITQHEDQLRSWWEPLATHFPSLGQDQKAIESICFAPTLGIYIQVNASKKTTNAPEEGLVGTLLKEATATWKPRRFEIDNSYSIRTSLIANWQLVFAVAIVVGAHGVIAYDYIHFFGDTYYALLGSAMAFIGAGSLVCWFYPKMEGSVYRLSTSGRLFMLGFVCMSVTFSYLLVGVNMLSKQTVCDISAPVTKWYSRSGKSRSYYAGLDLHGCSADIPLNAEIKVNSADYQTGSNIRIRVSRGLLHRYILERISDKPLLTIAP